MIFQFCIKSGDNFNLFKTTIISLRDSIILRTVATTIDSLRRYTIVYKQLRDSRDAVSAHINMLPLLSLSARQFYSQRTKCGSSILFTNRPVFYPLRSTVPFIPPCTTWEKYFTARCAKPLQAISAHLTAVYHFCAGYSFFKFLIYPSTYRELGEAFLPPISQNFHIDL